MDIIKEDIFRKQLKTGLRGGYLFFGEEDYLKSFSLRAAREAVCADETFAVFNDVQIAPIDYTPSALLSALMPPPMMSDYKIVTLNGLAISAMKQNELDELYEVLSTLEDYDYNVLIISVPSGLIDEGNLPKRPSAVFSELSKYLTPVRFDAVTGARLVSWVGKHFEHHGVRATPEVCTYRACGQVDVRSRVRDREALLLRAPERTRSRQLQGRAEGLGIGHRLGCLRACKRDTRRKIFCGDRRALRNEVPPRRARDNLSRGLARDL